MENFRLRPAAKEDAPRINKFILNARLNPTGLDWHRFVLVETIDGIVIACGQIKPHRDGSIELASMVVDLKWRGQGVGGMLIKALIEKQNGPVFLMCRSSLGSFYQRFGFVALDVEEMPTYFRRISKIAAFIEPLRKEGETLLVMGRDVAK